LQFAGSLREAGLLGSTRGVLVQLYGSLGRRGAATARTAPWMLGLEGEEPERIDPDMIETRVARIRERARWDLLGSTDCLFRSASTWCFHRRQSLPFHPNGMPLCGVGAAGEELVAKQYSDRRRLRGGRARGRRRPDREDDRTLAAPVPQRGRAARAAAAAGVAISRLNDRERNAWRPESEALRLTRIWQAMQDCVRRGCSREGVLRVGSSCAGARPSCIDSCRRRPRRPCVTR